MTPSQNETTIIEISQQPESAASQGRRDFLLGAVQALTGIVIVGSVVPLISSCSNPSSGSGISHGTATVSVASLVADNTSLVSSDLKPEGSSVLIVRQSPTTYITVSMHCQHMGCTVNAPVGNTITCSCHGSTYGITGNLISGPSTKSLSTYATVYNASAKTVTITY